MNESVIIIGIGILIVASAGAMCWYFGQYLYEWYIEKFTVDPDPDNPEVQHRPEIDIYEKIDKVLMFLPKIRQSVEDGIASGIRTIRKTYEDYRTESYREPEPTREEILQRVRGRHSTPIRRGGIPNKPTSIPRPRPDQRGHGKDYWEVPKGNTRNTNDDNETWDTGLYRDRIIKRHSINKKGDIKVDLMGRKCPKCGGTFQSTIIRDKIQCSNCGIHTNRYLLKRSGTRHPGPS